MRTSRVDVFGPDFMPGKVVVAHDAPTRALQRGIPWFQMEQTVRDARSSSAKAKPEHDGSSSL